MNSEKFIKTGRRYGWSRHFKAVHLSSGFTTNSFFKRSLRSSTAKESSILWCYWNFKEVWASKCFFIISTGPKDRKIQILSIWSRLFRPSLKDLTKYLTHFFSGLVSILDLWLNSNWVPPAWGSESLSSLVNIWFNSRSRMPFSDRFSFGNFSMIAVKVGWSSNLNWLLLGLQDRSPTSADSNRREFQEREESSQWCAKNFIKIDFVLHKFWAIC